jgi:capsular polysaccharide biosynthesis protein
MNQIKKLSDIEVYINLYKSDENNRIINIHHLKNAQPIGNLYYPNCLLKSDSVIYNPINERIMSLSNVTHKEKKFDYFEINKKEETPVFFFIYNTDNYYHFVYDTLPYLISFLELKKHIKDVKLLMNYPNSSKNEFYRFVDEFLDILDITKDDILIVDKNTVYDSVYISSSYTHGDDSNLPPRKEIYEFYQKIVDIVVNSHKKETPKKIYISRRTWINNDLSNIGTNYTTRRRLVVEDELVSLLTSNGYEEIFTESLTTIEKILMFQQADTIIGSIGGGLCNVLFSNKESNLIALISPTFLDVNERFKYSFEKVNTFYFNDSYHIEIDKWKKYMRVSYKDIVGEVEEVMNDKLLISYVNENVAGWNSSMNFNKIELYKSECVMLDNGLNSSWSFDIEKIKKYI